MPVETELKLRLPSSQAALLASHPLLQGVVAHRCRLFNTYYDTPDLDLAAHRIALRLRRKGRSTWLMTVKGGDSGAGGLAQRNEWEAPTEPGVFDFGIVTDPDLRDLLESCRATLQPLFTTDFTRTSWLLRRGEAAVEIAFDRGRIGAGSSASGASAIGTKREMICELELELVEGTSSDVLFDIAIELAADVRLHPEVSSKAERGYALALGAASPPAKAFASPVCKDMSPDDAFRSIALASVLQLQRNEAGAVAGEDPEYVHQARVAIRRLRSAFRLFSPVLTEAFIEVYSPRWRDLAKSLGDARDWDVFLSETLAPLEEAFPGDHDLRILRERSEAAKAKARKVAGVALGQNEYSRLLLAFSAALLRGEPPTIAAHRKAVSGSLRKFVAKRLQKRVAAIDRLTNGPGKMNAERWHKLRIEFKKLRYAVEFFSPLMSGKRLVAYQTALAAIQDQLGRLNDQATASRLIRDIHPKGEPDPLTQGWIAGRTDLLISSLNDELRRFAARKKPWR